MPSVLSDGGAIERPAQHLAVVGQASALALGIEQAGAEHVEQRIEQEEAEEEEAAGRRWRAAGAGWCGMDERHGSTVSRAGS